MSESTPPEEKVITPTTAPAPATSSLTPGLQRNLISISAAVVFFSFFLPWVSILGANISGLDLQKEVDSYKLVWLLPALAVITLLLNIANQNTSVLRRVAGLCPFAILAYALNQMGADLFKIVAIGGWLALIGGVSLIFIPNVLKPAKAS